MKYFGWVDEVGQNFLFLSTLMKSWWRSNDLRQPILEQTWKITISSLSTTLFAGFFVGAILTVQFTLQMREFGALGYLGGLSTSGIVREVGPLLIAFLLSGKVGAYTSAELGTMRVTEQIDAIRCLGADPLKEVVLPRFVGIVFSSFFLLTFGLIVSVFGGAFMGYIFSGVNFEEYIRFIPSIVTLPSVINGLFKCLAFSLVLATVCTYKGYTASGGARGVGQAVVQTAVQTMLLIVFFDWLTSFLMQSFINQWMNA